MEPLESHYKVHASISRRSEGIKKENGSQDFCVESRGKIQLDRFILDVTIFPPNHLACLTPILLCRKKKQEQKNNKRTKNNQTENRRT